MMFSILQVSLMFFLQVNSGKHFTNVCMFSHACCVFNSCKHAVVIQGLVFHVSNNQTIIIIIAIIKNSTMYNAKRN